MGEITSGNVLPSMLVILTCRLGIIMVVEPQTLEPENANHMTTLAGQQARLHSTSIMWQKDEQSTSPSNPTMEEDMWQKPTTHESNPTCLFGESLPTVSFNWGKVFNDPTCQHRWTFSYIPTTLFNPTLMQSLSYFVRWCLLSIDTLHMWDTICKSN